MCGLQCSPFFHPFIYIQHSIVGVKCQHYRTKGIIRISLGDCLCSPAYNYHILCYSLSKFRQGRVKYKLLQIGFMHLYISDSLIGGIEL